jgi:hypothetical protein
LLLYSSINLINSFLFFYEQFEIHNSTPVKSTPNRIRIPQKWLFYFYGPEKGVRGPISNYKFKFGPGKNFTGPVIFFSARKILDNIFNVKI